MRNPWLLLLLAAVLVFGLIAAFGAACEAQEQPGRPDSMTIQVSYTPADSTSKYLWGRIILQVQELPPPNPQYDGPPFVLNPYGENYYWDEECQCWVWTSRYFGLLTQEVEPDTTGGG